MKLIRTIALSVARLLKPVIERSSLAREVLRSARFPGRGLIVSVLDGTGMPNERIVARCGQLLFDLDLRDDVQRSIYFNAYDRADLEMALALVPEGGTCFDVGANVGYYTLHLAAKVGTRGRVYAFEPDAANANLIERNCVLNGLEHIVKVHRKAVSAEVGVARFYRSGPGHSGWGSLVEFPDIVDAVIEVPTTSLDEVVRAEKIERVALMKMDIEANEFEGLAGAARSLTDGRIQNVLIEFNGIRLAERGRKLDEMLELFETHGYQPAGTSPGIITSCRSGATDSTTICLNLLFTHDRPAAVAPRA